MISLRRKRVGILVLWLAAVSAALWVVARAQYVADLSAFLPAAPTPLQRLLVEQLRDGPASRLILVALEGGDAGARARLSAVLAARLRRAPQFTRVDNGEPLQAAATQALLFQHRYLLSDAVTTARFSAAGLDSAIEASLDELGASAGTLLKPLFPHDPTGELLHIIDELGRIPGPSTPDGVWVSADGSRTLLTVQTAAAGSDTDAQERDLDIIRSAFLEGVAGTPAQPSAVRLHLSGPGVFAVAARTHIKHAATRLSTLGALLVIGVLLAVYRSLPALALGLLPVASGALAGIASVALGFGVVHGITLGFGATLIGEAVDYSIYFFIQSCHRHERGGMTDDWRRRLWPTVRLGMFASVVGFASLLPSGFPGLAQLGLYSICGLLSAGLVTRFVLPELTPASFEIRSLESVGEWLGRCHESLRGRRRGLSIAAAVLALAALCLLYQHRATLWNRDLARLSPVPPQELAYDATLRADLGVADTLDLVVVGGADLESALQGAERAGAALQPLVDAGVLKDFDSPSRYLPSLATQAARRAALPERAVLEQRLRAAATTLELTDARLMPFVDDVEAARRGPLLGVRDLQDTSLAAGFAALTLPQPGHVSALLPLYGPRGADGSAKPIDLDRVSRALTAAGLPDTQVLDVKRESDALYLSYLDEAIRQSSSGFGLIALLMLAATRSPRRTAGIMAPLVLAVLSVAAGLAVVGVPLTLLHLVGMLLIVAVGSNYALFFDAQSAQPRAREFSLTLASLTLANACTVIGFGLLSFSQVPVLEALGETVAPGAFLALLFSAVLTRQQPTDPTGA